MNRFVEIDEVIKWVEEWKNLGMQEAVSTFLENRWRTAYQVEYDRGDFHNFLQLLRTDWPIRWLSLGEGEFSFLLERKSANDREVYTEAARQDLERVLDISKERYVYLSTIIGTPSHLGSRDLCDKAMKYLQDRRAGTNGNAVMFYGLLNDVYSKRGLRDQFGRDDLIEFLSFIKRNRDDIAFIGGEHLTATQPYVGAVKTIFVTPTLGATCWLEKIEQNILSAPRHKYYFFSCGIAGNALIARLHSKLPEAKLIDIGSFWDTLLGIGTRSIPNYDPPMIKPNEIV